VHLGHTFNSAPVNLTYADPAGTIVTVAAPAAVCEFTVQNWTLLELAGLAVLPHSLEDSDMIRAVFWTIFPGRGAGASWMFLDRAGLFPHVHVWKDASARPAVAFQGLSGRHQFAFMLENAGPSLYARAFALAVPLPFFDAARTALLGNLLRDCGLGLARVIGFGNATGYAWNDTSTAVELWAHDDRVPPVLVGHRPAGLLVKALALAYNTTGVALETLDLYDSLVWRSIAGMPGNGSIVNAGTRGSPFTPDNAMDERAQNVDLAGSEKWYAPDDPYATLCRVAAACVRDDQYDRLCNATIGMQRYVQFFADWKRPRAGRVN
jgi:hypothetical protein